LAEWRYSQEKPVFYHCISRVVDRRRVLGSEEKEKFRALMRVYERFSGCRVTAYCLMDNHIHLLLEVPPMAAGGLSDRELLDRLSALYGKASALVADVARELAEARQRVAQGLAGEDLVGRIHARYTYRMHDLGEFMKALLQRYTQWHNRRHQRSGRLWEDRFKSVIVEDGVAARTMAAYIDLNPVRAGMVEDPAGYRWSSYGEAIGGGSRGPGRQARAGLVRAWGAHQGMPADAGLWNQQVARVYRAVLMGQASQRSDQAGQASHSEQVNPLQAGVQDSAWAALPLSKVLRCRVRYFTDGAVIGSRGFVDEAFAASRWRFGPRRPSGARKFRGDAAPMATSIWSLRDLRKGIA
jgi:REP element-mobilizing transposase RayT